MPGSVTALDHPKSGLLSASSISTGEFPRRFRMHEFAQELAEVAKVGIVAGPSYRLRRCD